jgi:antirestriction protein ArdC
MADRAYHRRDLYGEVTSRILSELQAGAAPWVKPWSATPGMNHPHNAMSLRPYSGYNVVLLWLANQHHTYAAPRWLTARSPGCCRSPCTTGNNHSNSKDRKRMSHARSPRSLTA